MKTCRSASRRGITLIEVLLSIGILAIGLSSVIALVPAGRSEAAKAVVYDRAANLAANVLNDALTFGIAKPSSFGAGSGNPMVVFDPVHQVAGGPVWDLSTTNATAVGILKPNGVFATASAPAAGGGQLVSALLEGRDDVVYAAPAGPDEPPSNSFSGGVRSFLGRISALVSVLPLSGSLTPGTQARVTAVVFSNRSVADPGDIIAEGTYEDSTGSPVVPGTITLQSIPTGRAPASVLRPGTVVFSPTSPPAWFQVAMASVDETASPPLAYVTFVGGVTPPANAPVRIALDSVGLAERIVALEGSGPYGQ